MSKDCDKQNPGPEPERLKIDGDWEDAVKKAMGRPKPAEGWPEPEDDEDAETGRKEELGD